MSFFLNKTAADKFRFAGMFFAERIIRIGICRNKKQKSFIFYNILVSFRFAGPDIQIISGAWNYHHEQ